MGRRQPLNGLLDTHTPLYLVSDPSRVTESAPTILSSPDAILAGRISWQHKDPFDRVIVAQALRRNLTIATRDTKIIDAALTPTLTV